MKTHNNVVSCLAPPSLVRLCRFCSLYSIDGGDDDFDESDDDDMMTLIRI